MFNSYMGLIAIIPDSKVQKPSSQESGIWVVLFTEVTIILRKMSGTPYLQ